MKKHYNLLILLLLVILIIGGCALKDKLLNKEITQKEVNSNLLLNLEFNNISDSSDYGNEVIAYGGSIIDEFYSFDGKSYLKINKDFNNKEISIGFWIKPTKRQNGFILANGPVTNTPSLSIYFDTFKRIKFNRGRESKYTEAGTIPFNNWTFVFITNDGITKFYVNGVKISEIDQEFEQNSNHTETYIGKGFECSSIYGSFRCSDSFFYGDLDDVRIYNEVLNEEKIKLIYEEIKK
ncbi:MAG: LamG domain-containing protein [Nanoarchaeota archaeon]|nr:LamG domain-containing protein [Nanoarchaeota archaeon]MBU0962403.1 LamG domain-containing protein [Nanoarchaeota archaeon]